MAVSFILLKSLQTAQRSSHDRVAPVPWAASASPWVFILAQRLMGKLFVDLFLSLLENHTSGRWTGAKWPEGSVVLIKISVRDLCLFFVLSRCEGHPVVSSVSIKPCCRAKSFFQLHGVILQQSTIWITFIYCFTLGSRVTATQSIQIVATRCTTT